MTELVARLPINPTKTRISRRSFQTVQSAHYRSTKPNGQPVHSVVLPIISLSPVPIVRERSAAMSPTMTTNETPHSNVLHVRKSMIKQPSIMCVPQTQARFLCLVSTPNRCVSQQQQLKKNPTEYFSGRSHPQSGRFLTYLRLQSLANGKRSRLNAYDPSTVINSHRRVSPQPHFYLNSPLDCSTIEFSHRCKSRPMTSSPTRLLRRPSANLAIHFGPDGHAQRLTPSRSPSRVNYSPLQISSSALNTPRNSLADEPTDPNFDLSSDDLFNDTHSNIQQPTKDEFK